MQSKPSNGAIVSSLLLAVFLWGGNNAATKYLVGQWPPILVGCSRFLFAGLILMAVLRWTRWLGVPKPLTAEVNRSFWLRGGLNLALYILAFTWALTFTSASHVALYLGAAPVWALLWEKLPERSWRSAQRYGAAALALAGVVILLWPALHRGSTGWLGELLGLASSVLWTNYGRQCRHFGTNFSGAEISAHTFWRAALLLLPVALVEAWFRPIPLTLPLLGLQLYCVVASGVFAFLLWNNALRHWVTSQVYLFNNLIPISTMVWAHFLLKEQITPTFWLAMACIVGGVLIGQAPLEKLRIRWMPLE